MNNKEKVLCDFEMYFKKSFCWRLARENIRFSSLFAAGDVSHGGTSKPAKSDEKRMFSQASLRSNLNEDDKISSTPALKLQGMDLVGRN